ncbi:MAG: carboxypeptidase regulatory-like domain-containing protein [Terracidiphilus sp.]|nr:carboxypeptidase regulatory-like domain-containing protein [Terracidiphilus sp.]
MPLLATIAFAVCSSVAWAQSGAGSIQGTVTDTTGAVIPGASIHVVNRATNVAMDTKTNHVGFYQVPGLFTGNYTVTIDAPNMRPFAENLYLQVAQTAVVNPVLAAGNITEKVEVSSDVMQLTTTENGTISSTLENTRINQLPMNGRMLLTLAGQTTPGLEGTGQRANGLMPEALEYVADGVSMTNRNFGGEGNSSQAQLPDPDAVQEVRMETTNTSAMYSAPATGIITTKSGTNGLHGSLFETARNNYVGIAKSRSNAANYAAPHLVRNEFGVSVGGPIRLPKLYNGKDKSFWFFAYERYSLAQATTNLMKVPTMAMRGGDFSGLINGSGLQQLYDPATTTNNPVCPILGKNTTENNPYCRTPFANNQIPAGRISPFAKVYYQMLPKPSSELSSINPLTGSNLAYVNPNSTKVPTITWRLDHSFSENDKAYMRYTSNNQTNWALRNSGNPASEAYGQFPEHALGYQGIEVSNYGAAIGYTHIFSPTFYSETIASQQWFSQLVGPAGNPNMNYESILGLPNNFGEPGFPATSGEINAMSTTQYQYQENQILSTLDENLTKTMGRHQLQFGGRYRHERFQYIPGRSADSITYTTQTTALESPNSGPNYSGYSNTGFGEGDFFLGSAYGYTVQLVPPTTHYHDMELDAYLQDNWHISRNLTLNIGGRYEAHPAIWTKDGLTPGLDLNTHAIVLSNPTSFYVAKGYTTQAILANLTNFGVKFETPAEAGYQNVMLNNYDLTVSPRVGLAWQPFNGRHGTVVRGAYGRYIYPVPIRNSVQNAVLSAPFVASYSMNYSSASTSPDGKANYLIRNQQPVITGQATGAQSDLNVVDTTTTHALKPGLTGFFMAPDYAPDYVTQTNFTIEQPLKGSSVLRATWLWSHGTNLDHYYYPNYSPWPYIWEMTHGTPVPAGGDSVIGTPQQNTYAATALGPFDQTVFGNLSWNVKSGWSNDNALQVNYQRLFHHGTAYQITYVWSKPFRLGGNYFRDGQVDTAAAFLGSQPTAANTVMTSKYAYEQPSLPPARPAGVAPWAEWHGLDAYEAYMVDTAIPKHHITFNGIYDLPLGRGKKYLANSNRLVDEVVGGWEVAGSGQVVTQDFAVASIGNPVWSYGYGPTNPIKYHKADITDCTTGTCTKAKMWFNGFIPPSQIAGNSCPTGVSAGAKTYANLPSDWAPNQQPIDNDCTDSNYGWNAVQITSPGLNNGKAMNEAYWPGPTNHRYSKTVLNGPINYNVDMSLFKVFPISGKTSLRFNMDAFNVFNIQGMNNPNAVSGILEYKPHFSSSYWTPRQVQFTLRFTY